MRDQQKIMLWSSNHNRNQTEIPQYQIPDSDHPEPASRSPQIRNQTQILHYQIPDSHHPEPASRNPLELTPSTPLLLYSKRYNIVGKILFGLPISNQPQPSICLIPPFVEQNILLIEKTQETFEHSEVSSVTLWHSRL